MRLLLAVLALAAALPAAAQVHKCVDSAGKVSFSDAPCPASAKQSQRVMGEEATSTYDPYARERTLQSYERATAISRSINDDAASRPGGAALMDSDPNQRIRAQDQRNMQRRLAEIEAQRQAQEDRNARAELARQRAAQEAAFPRKLSRCDGSFCYDTQGGSYMRNGDGTLLRSGGGVCRQVPGLAGQFSCN